MLEEVTSVPSCDSIWEKACRPDLGLEAVELLYVWDEQGEYERIRPLALLGGSIPESSVEAGTSERAPYRSLGRAPRWLIAARRPGGPTSRRRARPARAGGRG